MHGVRVEDMKFYGMSDLMKIYYGYVESWCILLYYDSHTNNLVFVVHTIYLYVPT